MNRNDRENMVATRLDEIRRFTGESKSYKTRSYAPLETNLSTSPEYVLTQLGLSEYFPQKLTLQKVLTLTKEAEDNPKPKHPHDVPWYFLRSVTLLNNTARENTQFSGLSNFGSLKDAGEFKLNMYGNNGRDKDQELPEL